MGSMDAGLSMKCGGGGSCYRRRFHSGRKRTAGRGVIAGAGVWAVLQNGLTFANAPVAIRNIIIGIIVVVCVLMDIVRTTGKTHKWFPGEE